MKRTGKKAVATLLAGVALCGTFAMTGCDLFGKDKEEPTDKPSVSVPGVSETPQYDGTIVQAGGKYNFSNKIAFLGADVTPTGENGEYTPISATLTATVLPEDANQAVSWRVSFVDATSAWASGKAVSDYVTVSTQLEGGKTATVTCLAPFGEQVKIECISQDNPDIKAECAVDFIQAIEDVSLAFGTDLPINLGGTTNVVWEINPDGTGRGGNAKVVIHTSDTYTVAVDYTWDIDLHSVFCGNGHDAEYDHIGIYGSDTYFSETDSSFIIGRYTASGEWRGSIECARARLDDIESLTFDYAFLRESKLGFKITDENGRDKEVYFYELTPLEMINYSVYDEEEGWLTTGLQYIDVGDIYTLHLNVTGIVKSTIISKEYNSVLSVTGYTNTAKVQSVTIDKSEIDF